MHSIEWVILLLVIVHNHIAIRILATPHPPQNKSDCEGEWLVQQKQRPEQTHSPGPKWYKHRPGTQICVSDLWNQCVNFLIHGVYVDKKTATHGSLDKRPRIMFWLEITEAENILSFIIRHQSLDVLLLKGFGTPLLLCCRSYWWT